MTPPSHYEILGVPTNATVRQIKAAYRKAARATHPDHGGDAAHFHEVTLAYEVLSDPQARQQYDRSYGPPAQVPRAAGTAPGREAGFSSRTGAAGDRAAAAAPAVYVPSYDSAEASAVVPLSVARQQIHGVPRKRGIFGATSRLQREARTVALLAQQIVAVMPSARLINGLHTPGEHGYIDHALLAGYRLALIDSMLLPKGIFRWDGSTLHKDGRVVEPPRLAPAVRRMQDLFPELNVQGWTVIHSPDGNLHEPVVDYARGYDPGGYGPVHVVNAARLVRELKQFLSSGPAPNTVHVPSLARLLAGMHR
ncbi:J domain-containing protein [Arthrobacter mobilis]|uniref:J domain-containing protein n=1 Tax=Arthrobacter mobilis TaxID=2724944 RepID=A0A7X6HCW1_9MICC|nr:J domain-containing protein [Arthrobacter mobilis]NKX53808.1 J domain-containing protein [Arthrobacter mobilis]